MRTAKKHRIIHFRIVLLYAFLIALSGTRAEAAVPFGAVEGVTLAAVSGWAYDEDAGTQPITVYIYVDNEYAGQVLANGYRPGVPQVLPQVRGDYHGYEYELPGLLPGTHCVKVYAIDYPSGNRVQLPCAEPCQECISVEQGTVFLDNGILKVGINLDWGGSISEIDYQGINLVNKHDDGRLVQVAIYDGAQAYSLSDYMWSGWGYNPTQAGDKYGHYSSVLEALVSNDSVYTRTRALEWNPDNKGGGEADPIPSDLYVEQWVNVIGQSVRVEYRLTHTGNDTHAATNQSFPCVYVNRVFDRLVTYVGNRPWGGDGITQMEAPAYPEEGVMFQPTESWGSFVDSSGSGLTVYSNFPSWIAQLYPESGTNVIIPLALASIGPRQVTETTAYLVAGKVEDARSMIYSLHEKDRASTSWEFNQDGNTEGWYPWNDISALQADAGTLKGVSTGVDPYMGYWGALGLEASRYSNIEIRMKVDAGNVGVLYFITTEDGTYDGNKLKTFSVNPGTEFVTYNLDMSSVSKWAGIISQIRLDPTNAGGKMEIDYIRILPKGRSNVDLRLTAGGTDSAATVGGSGVLQSGYASLDLLAGDKPYATAVFGFAQSGVTVSEAGVPASPPTIAARVFIDYRAGVRAVPSRSEAGKIDINTGIAVVNCGSATANVRYTLRNVNGASITTGHGTIAAGAHFAKFINDLKDMAPDFVFPADLALSTQFASLEISSDQPLSVLALRGTTNQRGEFLISTTPVVDLTQTPVKDPLYFPQFADGGGYTTSLVLLNTSSSIETGMFEILDDNGNPLVVKQFGGVADSSFRYSIPPDGVFRFQTDGSSEGLKVGWVRLTPYAGTSSPIGSGLFGYNPADMLVTESGVPAAAATTHARIYVDLSANHNTGLAIANVTDSNASISLSAFRADGSTGMGTSQGPLMLNASGHRAKFSDDFIKGLPPGFTGVLEITSATPFAAVTLRTLVNERDDFLITTFPIADANHPAPAPVVFPQIADGGGYATEFILLSATGAATTTVNFFGDTGAPLAVGK